MKDTMPVTDIQLYEAFARILGTDTKTVRAYAVNLKRAGRFPRGAGGRGRAGRAVVEIRDAVTLLLAVLGSFSARGAVKAVADLENMPAQCFHTLAPENDPVFADEWRNVEDFRACELSAGMIRSLRSYLEWRATSIANGIVPLVRTEAVRALLGGPSFVNIVHSAPREGVIISMVFSWTRDREWIKERTQTPTVLRWEKANSLPGMLLDLIGVIFHSEYPPAFVPPPIPAPTAETEARELAAPELVES